MKNLRDLMMVAALTAACVYGQGLTGSITGSITDQSGAAIPGAELTLVNVQTSQTRQARTDSNGDFVFTQLLPGDFKLSVVAKGFKKHEQTGLILSSAERLVVKTITLDLGEVTQTVEVTAEAARLQTQSAERSGLISTEQTQNI
ncbi:MAG: carboxypeptidase regulatory-like domain-containing protein, partial [Candidatus Solibacter usitatus]|nr:carboxypeptidase regulatory-like domain-containing protein [Candidatus Solibacter usitatus]